VVLCACVHVVGQMLKTSVNRFNNPWTDDLYYIVMNTVRLFMCIILLSKKC